LLEKSLELSRKLDERWCTGLTLFHMVGTGIRQGQARRRNDYAEELAWSEEGFAIMQALGAKRWIAAGRFMMGHVTRLQGNLERAEGLYRQSLASYREVGDNWIATECLEGLALIDSARGNAPRAARLFGAAETARQEFGIRHLRTDAGDQIDFWTTIRERPDETVFVNDWAAGRAMTLEQAAQYVLAINAD
jgi:hypothetical protein